MSIESMTAIAVARDLRNPTKSDAGVVTSESVSADEKPDLVQMLAKTLPVGLVTAYTAFIAAVTQLIAEPTSEEPNPEQYLWLRWAGFAILVITAAVLTFLSYRQKKEATGSRAFPVLEVTAVTVAAAAYGLGIPESPLLAALDDKTLGLGVLTLIAFAGVAVNLTISSALTKKA